MKILKKSNKHRLVKKWSDHKKGENFKEALGSTQGGSGIYALYRGKKLWYVGKSLRSMRGRIKKHTTDRHNGRWNNFSFYQIKKKKYVDDVERLILNIFKPPGNDVGGRFRKKYKQ